MAMLIKVKPEEVGFSSARLTAVSKLMHRYLKAGLIPGAIVVIAKQGKLVAFDAYGKMDIEQNKSMREETLFRIYSMTKPLTAVALLTLYEQGLFQLSDPVSQFIPAFKELKVLEGNALVTPKREMTIHDLLTHQAGFSQPMHPLSSVAALYRTSLVLQKHSGETVKGLMEKLAEFPLAFHPGTSWHYSLSYHVLAYLVELFSGKPFDEFIAKKISQPLGLLDTSFYVPKHKASRLAVTYTHDKQEKQLGWALKTSPVVLKRVQSEEDFLKPPSLLSGSGGLVSTATDYLRFCQMLLNRGELDGNRILGRKTVDLMTSQHLPADLAQHHLDGPSEYAPRGVGYGLGVGVTLDPAQAQVLGSKGDYFWGGKTGTYFLIDPQEEIIGIFLTQVDGTSHPYSFAKDFRSTLYQALN